MEDKTLELLKQRVEEMGITDKTGLSFVEVYKPYSDFYNYVMMKIGSLSEKEQLDCKKLLHITPFYVSKK